MESAEIPFLPAYQLADHIKSRDVSPVEVVEAYLERIGSVDPKVNSYLTVCAEEALLAARESEVELVRGRYRGAMHGIPVGVKDQIFTRGIPTTGGSPVFKDYVPSEDATLVSKLKSSGAIVLGKTNLTEFATSTSLSYRFKAALNPWDLDRYAGSSSGGSAAAAAASLCATSLGEDTGGSIRVPASWCGVVGVKPSWGRVSRRGLMRGIWSMDTIGPFGRTVEDCAMTLQVIAGQDSRDPHTWAVPVPDYKKALDGDIKGLRIGVVKELMGSEEVDAEVRDALVKAIDVLGELGASVEEVSIPLSAHARTIMGGLKIEPPITHRELVRHHLQELGQENRVGYIVGGIFPAQAYYKAQKLTYLLRSQIMQVLEKEDVLVLPTAAGTAQEVEPEPTNDTGAGHHPRLGPVSNYAGLSSTPGIFTQSFSLAATPALSICCGFTSQNLPIGLQIGGRLFGEATMLKVAHAYEQNTPWHTRRPPL